MTEQQKAVRQVVIVGASYGGLAVASELRAAGFKGGIRLIGDENVVPYHRTHLSKECPSGDLPPPSALHPESYFADRDIDLHRGTSVVAIRPDLRTVRCSDGAEYPYDRLVLALGASSRRGSTIDGEQVLTLRSAADGELLVQRLRSSSRVAVVGDGLIGLEVAAAASACGLDVAVLEAAPRLMNRSAYPPVSEYALNHHRRKGIDIRLGVQISTVSGQGISLADGTTIVVDTILAAVGSTPRVELAAKAGITCLNGIAADARGRTSAEGIYALGDCALWDHAGQSQRHESVAAAKAQAVIVASALLGLPGERMKPLRLWSTQGSLRIQMTGPVLKDADVVSESIEDGGLLVRALSQGRLIAVQGVNAPRAFNAALKDLEQVEEEFAES